MQPRKLLLRQARQRRIRAKVRGTAERPRLTVYCSLTSIYAQYNSAGQLAATQVRLNYIFRTIDNFYLVFNDTRFTEGVFEGQANQSLVAKMTYSLHR